MLRPFSPPDLADAWYEASLIAHSFPPEEFFDKEREQIAHNWIPTADVTVFEDEGRVVGFVAMVDNEVGGLCVHPDFQRRGIGWALLDSVRKTRRYLESDVFAANEFGRRFYRACGFEFVDRHTSEATGHPEIRLRFEGDRTEAAG